MPNTYDSFSTLPMGRAPQPVAVPHFPDALHAVIWRNWDVIEVNRLAQVLQGTPEQITAIALSMGLPAQRCIPAGELRRNYMTVLHRNWHLLPYEQLCPLLDWDVATTQFYLNEDDFMWSKLGGYKPQCPPVHYRPPNAATQARAKEIARIVAEEFGNALHSPSEPLFGFIERFKQAKVEAIAPASGGFQIRMVYPYFLRYGDPLKGEGIDDIPEGYLAELAASGINVIWLQGLLNTLAPWDLVPELSVGWEERLANLNSLVRRCRAYGIDVFLYLNEPRAMPRSFFEKYPELRGIDEIPEGRDHLPDVVGLCTSTPAGQAFLVNSVRHVFESVPDLGGLFSITFSENLTNCCSRGRKGNTCPRCQKRDPEAVHAEVYTLLEKGMRLAGSNGKFLSYVWTTLEEWIPGIIDGLTDSASVLCVSEFNLPFTRGDYMGALNEYSISAVGPSEQSRRQWALARRRGLKTAAKIAAVSTWELPTIPYIPALRLVGQHLSNVAAEGIDALLLGWTNGGSPSPNLEMVAEFVRNPGQSVDEAMHVVARHRFGEAISGEVVRAWNLLSDAFEEFPFDVYVCYFGPQALGPANLLYLEPSGFQATMVTFPFDDLEKWRGPYSVETLQSQFEKLAHLWQPGVELLDTLRHTHPSSAIEDEWRNSKAALLLFRSTINQIRFVRVRDSDHATAAAIVRDEMDLARQLFDLAAVDSRLGFEATNQYGFIRFDLAEKILNCENLLARLEKRGQIDGVSLM